MARPLRLDIADGIYHVIARGNERKRIFVDEDDRRFYLARLAGCSDRFDVRILAYCLMDNHVHLAIQRGATSVSRFVHAVHSCYSQRFNRRHARVGHLFQGRFKSFLVEKDAYLIALVRYIHLNPVRARIVSRPGDYLWSSDHQYRTGRSPSWLRLEPALAMLAPRLSVAIQRYKRLLNGGAGETAYDEAHPAARSIQGTDEFADRVLANASRSARRRCKWTLEDLVAGVANEYGVTVGDLKGRRRGQCSEARAVAAYIGREEAGIPVARTAAFLGREESTLVRVALRLEDRMRVDQRLQRRVCRLAVRLRSLDTGTHG